MSLDAQWGDDRPSAEDEREARERHCRCGATLPDEPTDGYDIDPEPVEWVTDPSSGDVHDVGGREGAHVEIYACAACGRDTFVEVPL